MRSAPRLNANLAINMLPCKANPGNRTMFHKNRSNASVFFIVRTAEKQYALLKKQDALLFKRYALLFPAFVTYRKRNAYIGFPFHPYLLKTNRLPPRKFITPSRRVAGIAPQRWKQKRICGLSGAGQWRSEMGTRFFVGRRTDTGSKNRRLVQTESPSGTC